MYNALDIAKVVVNSCLDIGFPVSNLKLQKMLYYLWIDYYKKTRQPLFADDICAWQLGPVIPNVYNEFCTYGGRAISSRYVEAVDKQTRLIISEIAGKYIEYSVTELANMARKGGTPWSVVFQNGNGSHDKIPYSLIIQQKRTSEGARG